MDHQLSTSEKIAADLAMLAHIKMYKYIWKWVFLHICRLAGARAKIDNVPLPAERIAHYKNNVKRKMAEQRIAEIM